MSLIHEAEQRPAVAINVEAIPLAEQALSAVFLLTPEEAGVGGGEIDPNELSAPEVQPVKTLPPFERSVDETLRDIRMYFAGGQTIRRRGY